MMGSQEIGGKYYVTCEKKSFLAERVGSVMEENLRGEYGWYIHIAISFILVSKIFPTIYILNKIIFLYFLKRTL